MNLSDIWQGAANSSALIYIQALVGLIFMLVAALLIAALITKFVQKKDLLKVLASPEANLKKDLWKAFKRSGPLTLVFLVTIVVLVTALVFVHHYYGEEIAPQKSKTTSGLESPPKENLFSVNAKILAVDTKKKEVTVAFEDFGGGINWNKQWKLVVGEKTILATQESYSKAIFSKFEVKKTQNNSSEKDKVFEQNLKRLPLADFKAGDVIYVISGGDDFAKVDEAKNVKAILLQKI